MAHPTDVTRRLPEDPEPASEGIARAGAVLRQARLRGDEFDDAWEAATRKLSRADRVAMRWARDVFERAYRGEGDAIVSTVLMEA